jgi:hypothetical protein
MRVQILQVLAVEARLVASFGNKDYVPETNTFIRIPSVEGILQKRWAHLGTATQYEPVVMTTGGDIMHAADLDTPTSARRTVACDWSPAEDDERLAPIAVELAAEVRGKAEASPEPSPAKPPGRVIRDRNIEATERAAEARRAEEAAAAEVRDAP